jgi:hypothetical protein
MFVGPAKEYPWIMAISSLTRIKSKTAIAFSTFAEAGAARSLRNPKSPEKPSSS